MTKKKRAEESTEAESDDNNAKDISLEKSAEEEDGKEESSKKCDLFQVVTAKHKNKWQLPQELSHFYNLQSWKFISDKDLNEMVRDNFPVPTNIRTVPNMDEFMSSMWESRNINYMFEKDKDLQRIHNKIRDDMGPLSSDMDP